MAFRPFRDPQFSWGTLQDEFNRVMERIRQAGVAINPFDNQMWGPLVDLYEQPDQYVIFAEVPGVSGNEIEVTQAGNMLTLTGEKRRSSAIGQKDHPVRMERRFGAFTRTIELPPGVDPDQLSARCTNGVLEITIRKNAAAKPKTVKVQVQE